MGPATTMVLFWLFSYIWQAPKGRVSMRVWSSPVPRRGCPQPCAVGSGVVHTGLTQNPTFICADLRACRRQRCKHASFQPAAYMPPGKDRQEFASKRT